MNSDARKRWRTALPAWIRLAPYVRPVGRPVLGAVLATVGAMAGGLVIPLVIQRMIDGPIAHRDLSALWWPLAALVLLGATEAGLFYARRKLVADPTTRIEAALRADLYRHLQRLPVTFHDRQRSGQLLSRSVDDLVYLRKYLAFAAVFLVVNCLTLVIGLVVLSFLSAAMALVAACFALPVLASSFLYEMRYKSVARDVQQRTGDLTTTIGESVVGIRVIKAFGRSRHREREFVRQAAALRDAETRLLRIVGTVSSLLFLLPELGIVGQLVVGAAGLANGTLTVGTLVAGVTVATFLRWPAECIGWALSETSVASATCDRYWEIADTPVTLRDNDSPLALPDPPRGRVCFERVSLDAPDGGPAPLRGVDLTVEPGESLALVGPSGAGKSLLASLVPRLADPTGGRVTLDGRDVRDLSTADLRGHVGVVFDEPMLRSGSVRANVTLGVPDATDAEVRHALRVALAAGFVDGLPEGVDTELGELGARLSGGQRQRIALARAVLRRPSVLVLDDPLSALDVRTARSVEASLRENLPSVTKLFVLHQPHVLRHMDRIAVMRDGRVTGTGTPDELAESSPYYRALLAGAPRPPAPPAGAAVGGTAR